MLLFLLLTPPPPPPPPPPPLFSTHTDTDTYTNFPTVTISISSAFPGELTNSLFSPIYLLLLLLPCLPSPPPPFPHTSSHFCLFLGCGRPGGLEPQEFDDPAEYMYTQRPAKVREVDTESRCSMSSGEHTPSDTAGSGSLYPDQCPVQWLLEKL